MDTFLEQVLDFVETRGTNLLVCVVALIFGSMAINNIIKIVKRVLINGKIDDTIVKLSLTIIKVILYFMIILYMVATLGIKLTGFIAVFSALSLAAGLAIQDVISGIANGIVIVSSKPFKVGDYVKIGNIEGMIREIRIMHTIIDTVDRVQIFLPNKTVYNADISNFSMSPIRRLDFDFRVDYDTDMNKAIGIIRNAINSFKHTLKNPKGEVYIKNIEDSAVIICARFWVTNENFWPTKKSFYGIIFEEFNKVGISFPFPQITFSQRESLSISSSLPNNETDKINAKGDNI